MTRLSRIAIVGIGNELRGDDAAGVMIARTLRTRLHKSHVLVIDAGPAPENHTALLRRFAPDLVLLIDAAQMNEAPGAIKWLAWQDTQGLSASTHTLPLYMLAQYLTAELCCEVALIGIQPGDTTIGASLSPDVQRTVEVVIGELEKSASRP